LHLNIQSFINNFKPSASAWAYNSALLGAPGSSSPLN
jgi:hypothetical protein